MRDRYLRKWEKSRTIIQMDIINNDKTYSIITDFLFDGLAAIFCAPFLKTLRQWRAGQGWLLKENDIRAYLKRWDITCKIEYTQHHLSHAAYAYYTQPYDDCAVICLDSIGEFETLTVWHGKNNNLKKIHSQGYPHSLGLFYSAMTQRIGLQAQRDEYLVAQWGAKGDPHKLFIPMLMSW